MKDSKYCGITSCCWSFRHELLGLILLIIATLLTIATCNSFGIVAMFLAGLVLCCYKHVSCHIAHGNTHCNTVEDSPMSILEKEEKSAVKRPINKPKK